MQTLIIYFDESKKSFHKITPFRQGGEYDSQSRFDGRWNKLVEHLTGGNYYKFEII